MCYSAQVQQSVRKLYRELGIRLDYAETERMFLRRLDDSGILVSKGFEANFDAPEAASADPAERRIRSAIETHRARQAEKFERELFSQRTRLANAERSLERKDSKKAREDARIASRKIEVLMSKLSDLRRIEPRPRDNRIFPMVHAGVIIRRDGANLLTPMRYFCRPAGKPALYDKKFPGLYNARRDNLERFWSGQFGRHHAIMVVESFFENVALHAMQHRELEPGEAPRNVVLQFTPRPPQPMLVACIWSPWESPGEPEVRGFAAITDEPPADVAAAGHDRCIVNLKPEHVDAWLTPANRKPADLQAILSDRAVPAFAHAALEAA
jgi:putative SOS response-associated peptidase YedK